MSGKDKDHVGNSGYESEKKFEGVEVADEERMGTPVYWSAKEFQWLSAKREGGTDVVKEERMGWNTGTPGCLSMEEFEWLAAEREEDTEEFLSGDRHGRIATHRKLASILCGQCKYKKK